jgi:hypothetical protein
VNCDGGPDKPDMEKVPLEYEMFTRPVGEDCHPVEFRTPNNRTACTYVYFGGQLHGLIRDWSGFIIGDPEKPFSFTRVHEWQTYHPTFDDAIEAAIVWVESCIVAGGIPEFDDEAAND